MDSPTATAAAIRVARQATGLSDSQAELMHLTIVLVPAAQWRLEKIASETGRKVEDLAAAAVELAALNFFSERSDDPADPANWVE